VELEERVNKRNIELESIVAELQRSQNYIERLANTVPAVIYIFDIAEKQLSYVNAHVRDMLGYSPEAIRKMKTEGLLELLHPQDEPFLQRYFQTVAKQRTGERIDVEFRVRHANGEWRYLHSGQTVFSRASGGVPKQILGMAVDVTDQRALERTALEMASEEQRHISQELHDTMGQVLTGLTMMGRNLRESLEEQKLPEAEAARRIEEEIKNALTQVRAVIKGLDPVDPSTDGLMTALAGLAERTVEVSGVRCRFVCHKPVLIGNNQIATDLFRIAQEAVTNALRHANARQIVVTLTEEDGQIVLRVQDDGTGMLVPAVAAKGMGLRIMQHRAERIGGEFTMSSDPKNGTEIVCKISEGVTND
jgi:two-component system CheB/CheR fusion protein